MINKLKPVHLLISLGAIAYVGIFLLPFSFASNDDVMMMGFLNGFYTGQPEGYAVFLHPFLSEGISLLYRLSSRFPWYPFLWFLFSFMSYLSVLKAVELRTNRLVHQLFWIVSYLLFSIHQLFLLQFTVVAGIMAFSGYILLFEVEIFSSKDHRWKKIFACSLIFISMLVRMEAFILASIGVGVFFGLRHGFFYVGGLIFRARWLWITVVVLIGTKQIYERAFDYRDYVKFNKARYEVIDHPVFWYITPQLNKVETPELFFFRNWLFEENHGIDTDFLAKTKQELRAGYFDFGYFLYSFQRIADFQKHHNFSLFTIIFYFIVLLSISSSRSFGLKFCLFWILFFLIFNYFFLVPHRVQQLFGLQLLGAAWLLNEDIKWKPSYFICFVSAIALILLVHIVRISQSLNLKENLVEEVELMLELIPRGEIAFTDLIGIENIDPKRFHQNKSRFIYFGWHSRSSMQARAWQCFGFNNLREVDAFYYLSTVEYEFVIPEYFNYINGQKFKKKLIKRQGNLLLFRFSK